MSRFDVYKSAPGFNQATVVGLDVTPEELGQLLAGDSAEQLADPGRRYGTDGSDYACWDVVLCGTNQAAERRARHVK